MNRWGIPEWLEEEVRTRDKICVYCGVRMAERISSGSPRRAAATWEHIVNDASVITRGNMARCCAACNSSKGTKGLSEWLESRYCRERGINRDTVAEIVKEALRAASKPNDQPAFAPQELR